METASSITNDFRDFQLWNLMAQAAPAPAPARGPYMVVQDGCDPEDPVSRKCSFVLTRRGTWLHCYLFFMLPDTVRRGVGVFDSVQDVFELAERLVGKPRVESANSVPDLLGAAGYDFSRPEAQAFLAQMRGHARPEAPTESPKQTQQ